MTMRIDPAGGPRVLMLGYNGANNTGAEALLLSDLEDVRAVLGPEARITVPTLNEANLRRYLSESATLRIAPIPTLYFAAIRRLVAESDLVLLVEGSTYMDTWGSPLLWAFLWATRCAARLGKPCLAYAVDAGTLRPFNARLVRRVASRTGLIVTRNRAAAGRLRAAGVSAPILSTADNAFTFRPRPEDEGWAAREWPRAAAGVVGLSLVDFSLWPVVMRPWGPEADCYKWPYYFSRSPARRLEGETLARGFAALADRVAAESGKAVALIAMEQVDEPLARRVHALMRRPAEARVFSSREHGASRLTTLLRGLDLLVTSRFHAAVLSLAAGVPMVAVGHDTRLDTLFGDLGLREEWFLALREQKDPAALFAGLGARVERLLARPEAQREALRRGLAEHLARARENRRLLAGFAAEAGLPVCEAGSGGAAWVA